MENQPIRILQRPCAIVDNSSINNTRIHTVKTLEQREAEYAAARRRIMGSHHSDGEEEFQVNNSKPVSKGLQSTQTIQHQCTVPTNVTNATPLMSIQATPTNNGALIFDFNRSTIGIPPAGISPRAFPNLHQGVAVSSSSTQKPVQHSANVPRTASQVQPQHQQSRVLSGSASSPSLSMGYRPVQQPVPLFTAQPPVSASTGLLPTPLGFHYAMQNTPVNVGLCHSQSAALLMHQINLFQQQYQQSMNGIHGSFPSTAIHTPNVTHMGLSSVVAQPNGSIKHAHPHPASN